MPPKPRPTPASERFRCDELQGERFHAHTDDVFRYNWWEVFCFPYILCARFWDCFISLCAGTNQCMVYWMMIQWLVCKITKLTTPNAIIFPYYFYMFCQVIVLTLFFAMLWHYMGQSLLIPYFLTFYNGLLEDENPESDVGGGGEVDGGGGEGGGGEGHIVEGGGGRRGQIKFRKYCFKKSEIFDTSMDIVNSAGYHGSYAINIVAMIIDAFLFYIER